MLFGTLAKIIFYLFVFVYYFFSKTLIMYLLQPIFTGTFQIPLSDLKQRSSFAFKFLLIITTILLFGIAVTFIMGNIYQFYGRNNTFLTFFESILF